MVYLEFSAERVRPSSRWLFWRYDNAYVWAWVDETDVGTAKSAAESRLFRKGWRASEYFRAKELAAEELPTDWVSRALIRHARSAGASFSFHRMSKQGGTGLMYLPSVGGGRGEVASRPALEDLQMATVPGALRPALALCGKWAISDDRDREEQLNAARTEDLQQVIDTVLPLFEQAEQWCSARRNAVPVPDEVVLLDLLLEAVTEMEAIVSARQPSSGDV